MRQEKFTQGNWRLITTDAGDQAIVVDEIGEIAQILVAPESEIQDIANAHLLKVAPKMYKLLKDLLRVQRTQQNTELFVAMKEQEISDILSEAQGEK